MTIPRSVETVNLKQPKKACVVSSGNCSRPMRSAKQSEVRALQGEAN